MTKIVPNDLLKPTEKTIKNWNCSFIAVEGPNIADKLSLEDLEIPYESQYRSRIVLKAGEMDQPLLYGFIGKAVTFLMIKVTYDSVNDPYYKYEQENYNISYYFDNDPTVRPLNRLMILTGSAVERIPQIFLNNPLGYDVVLDVLHATIDTDYEDGNVAPKYHPHYDITNITTYYTGVTSDTYIRCSGATDETGATYYDVYLPNATGSGNLLTIKVVDANVFVDIYGQNGETIDYQTTPVSLGFADSMELVDGAVGNWDAIY